LTGEEFVKSLDEENNTAFERLGRMASSGEAPESLTIDRLLRVALKNELEATEIAAVWIATTPEIEVKLALARQAGDEARHYRLICDRLLELGVDAARINPGEGGYSPLFEYLRSLDGTVARVAAGQFTREGIALVRNQCFLEFCEARGDQKTADLYLLRIQEDERHHHEFGRRWLAANVTSEDQREAARRAARKTIELAEEIQEMARLKSGLSRAPGC
jgi:uncharacterized ferritin-like protein (DUF455 family)